MLLYCLFFKKKIKISFLVFFTAYFFLSEKKYFFSSIIF